MHGDGLLAEQVAYYRARAPEYDNWWERRAQYALEPTLDAQWRAERAEIIGLVDRWLGPPCGRVLELACGTGNLTQHLAAHAAHVVAVDASPEVIDIARAKVPAGTNVEFVEADVFSWEPPSPRSFDVVFFSFWLSHVPPDRFDAFWAMVDRCLVPGGRAILIDNKLHDGVWPPVEEYSDDYVQIRTDLSSGESHRIVKVYFEPRELEQRLGELGWSAEITTTDRFFVLGHATRTP